MLVPARAGCARQTARTHAHSRADVGCRSLRHRLHDAAGPVGSQGCCGLHQPAEQVSDRSAWLRPPRGVPHACCAPCAAATVTAICIACANPCCCASCRDRSRTGALELTALSLKASGACELMDGAGQGGGDGVRAVHPAPGAHAVCKEAGSSCFRPTVAFALQTSPAHSPVSCGLDVALWAVCIRERSWRQGTPAT